MKTSQTVINNCLYMTIAADLMFDNTTLFNELGLGEPFINEEHRTKDEIIKLQQFSERLRKQLLEIDVNCIPELEFKASKLCHRDCYPLPNNINKQIDRLSDLSTLNQIVNNVNKYYLAPTIEKDIWLYSVVCKFFPLLIRSDGLALVSISRIETHEVVCNPPNHYQPGTDLTIRPDNLNKECPFVPLCLIDLKQCEDYLYNHTFELSKIENERWTIDEIQVNQENQPPIYLYVDGDCFC